MSNMALQGSFENKKYVYSYPLSLKVFFFIGYFVLVIVILGVFVADTLKNIHYDLYTYALFLFISLLFGFIFFIWVKSIKEIYKEIIIDIDNKVVELLDKNRNKTKISFNSISSIDINFDRFQATANLKINTDNKIYEITICEAKDFEERVKAFISLNIRIQGFKQ